MFLRFQELSRLFPPWTTSAWDYLNTFCLQLTSSEGAPWSQPPTHFTSLSPVIFSHRTQFFLPLNLSQSVITHWIVCLFMYCLPHQGAFGKQLGLCFSSLSRVPSSGAATDGMLHKYLLNEFALFYTLNVGSRRNAHLVRTHTPKRIKNNTPNLNFMKTRRLFLQTYKLFYLQSHVTKRKKKKKQKKYNRSLENVSRPCAEPRQYQ